MSLCQVTLPEMILNPGIVLFSLISNFNLTTISALAHELQLLGFVQHNDKHFP
jgi:hypothetical protein